jgi:hypothetical protein
MGLGGEKFLTHQTAPARGRRAHSRLSLDALPILRDEESRVCARCVPDRGRPIRAGQMPMDTVFTLSDLWVRSWCLRSKLVVPVRSRSPAPHQTPGQKSDVSPGR